MKYFLLILLIINSKIILSQDIVDHSESNIIENEQIIKRIENNYNVHFYYKAEWLKDVLLKEYQINNNLDSLLSLTFNRTKIHFYIYKKDNVILTSKEKINNLDNLSYEENSNVEIIYSNGDDRDFRERLKNEEKKVRRIGVPGGSTKRVILSGYVSEIMSGQKIEGVAVFADDGRIGTTTDRNGHYNLVLNKGYHEIHYQHIAMEHSKRIIEIYSGGKLSVGLIQKYREIAEVRIMGEDEQKEREVVGFETLKLKEIAELPTFMGEVDIIKQSLLLPGIQSSGEADMSFSVRGGKGDQNLVLIEGMHTYSYSHFFGFFPNVNPYTINKANLYKASIPIEFGNRISSVYDIHLKTGEYKKLSVEGGISPITASMAVSAPILKDKLSLSVAGRTTYSDYVFNKINLKEFNNSSASFYDFQVKLNYIIGDKSSVSLFYYKSYDDFILHKDVSYYFDNEIASLNWKYVHNDKLSASTVLGYTNYSSKVNDVTNMELASLKKQKLTDWKLNTKINYNLNAKHTLTSGIEALMHQLSPWSLYSVGETSTIKESIQNQDKAIVSSIFLSDNYKLSSKFSFDFGIRYMMYFLLGPQEKFQYEDNQILEKYITDTTSYTNNEIVYYDPGLDIRLSGTYKLKNNQNLNFCYNRNNQYIHLLTNSQGVTPTDSWQLSNDYIQPQTGDQYSLGYNIDLKNNKYFASIDIYYKRIENVKDFKDGSEFEFNSHPETEIIDALGRSYGVEVLLKKNGGRINGFLSYTYSRSLVQAESNLKEKTVNRGDYYPASNDKPHNLSAVINLKPTRRLTFSNVFNYSSGVPVTIPVSKMYFSDGYSIIYSDRNEYRIPDYFRWDASLTFKGSLKKKKYHSTWTVSIFNITSRKNAYSVYYKIEENAIQGYKLSVLGSAVPTITYKFSF